MKKSYLISAFVRTVSQRFPSQAQDLCVKMEK